jgi:hypothetical protein
MTWSGRVDQGIIAYINTTMAKPFHWTMKGKLLIA